jgi:hypothetical protein
MTEVMATRPECEGRPRKFTHSANPAFSIDAFLRARFITVVRLPLSAYVCLIQTVLAVNAVAADTQSRDFAFQTQRLPELIAILIVFLAGVLTARLVRQRGMPPLRRLPPLEAIPDAVGRATETGTPIVYITGWGGDMGRPTTMASMQILSHLYEPAGEHGCSISFHL